MKDHENLSELVLGGDGKVTRQLRKGILEHLINTNPSNIHKCESSNDTYFLISKETKPVLIGFTTPGWYLHIEDNGAWSKINYCPYCGKELE
ncbi:hypothetical protein [Paenibacillus peoriae]|uniref:hypothetical protein n=1 Tax=Paenibacillus peoriae TaxID=59893 RepID=UPI00096C0BC0|nr:hypothetical protein [Paenibacillus peoriae]OMF48601.1 hypothetical protein BK135_09910 [Paenibacillus peoriae]